MQATFRDVEVEAPPCGFPAPDFEGSRGDFDANRELGDRALRRTWLERPASINPADGVARVRRCCCGRSANRCSPGNPRSQSNWNKTGTSAQLFPTTTPPGSYCVPGPRPETREGRRTQLRFAAVSRQRHPRRSRIGCTIGKLRSAARQLVTDSESPDNRPCPSFAKPRRNRNPRVGIWPDRRSFVPSPTRKEFSPPF